MPEKTLQELLDAALQKQAEIAADVNVIHITDGSGPRPSGRATVSYDDLELFKGNTGYGGESLPRLHAWTDDRVYFKVVYDGAERVESVPRNPAGEEPGFYGGG